MSAVSQMANWRPAPQPPGGSALVVWRSWLAGRLCVPERVAWFEPDGAAQRYLHHQEREHRGADQRERDVEGGEGEQHVLVEHVLDERDDCVGKAESEGDSD